MNIAYVTHTRFPTEKAHGHQIARVCDALQHLGHTVTLVAPSIFTDIRQDPKRYYHLHHHLSVETVAMFDALSSKVVPGIGAFHVAMRSYRKALQSFFATQKYDLLYARSSAIVSALVGTGIPVVLELHTLPKRNKKQFVSDCNACKRVVCLTKPMQRELVSWGVQKDNTYVEGDAVDLDRFANMPSLAKAKHHYDLPDDRKIIGYIGSFVTMDKVEKGVQFIVDSLAAMRKNGENVYGFFVGGPPKWADRYRQSALSKGLTDHDFTFHGTVQSKLVPDAIAACDVCVYPAPEPKKAFFKRDTSPLKLYEYFAAGRPVVCADIPPLHGHITKDIAKLVHPGSVSSLTGGIREVLSDTEGAKKRVANAQKFVAEHTWEKRMERILSA